MSKETRIRVLWPLRLSSSSLSARSSGSSLLFFFSALRARTTVRSRVRDRCRVLAGRKNPCRRTTCGRNGRFPFDLLHGVDSVAKQHRYEKTAVLARSETLPSAVDKWQLAARQASRAIGTGTDWQYFLWFSLVAIPLVYRAFLFDRLIVLHRLVAHPNPSRYSH
jgi:hypothetical protein